MIPHARSTVGGLLRRFRGAAAGMALIEFSMALPIMLTLYLGGFQLMDAIGCNRKVMVTTRATADLVSQYQQLSRSDIATILNASTQIMYPFAASSAFIRVSEISTDTNGNSTITWSQAINGSAYATGTSFTVPPTIRTNGAALIYAEVRYTYISPISTFNIVSPRTLSQALYMVPRKANTVNCTDCV